LIAQQKEFHNLLKEVFKIKIVFFNTSKQIKMKNFKNFEIQLVNAVRYANQNENPTKKEQDEIIEKLGVGITNGQYDLVKRVYKSTLKSIAFQNKNI